MTTITAFVDVESLAVAWASTVFTSLAVGVETPPTLSSDFLRLTRIGGPVIGVRSVRATIAADYFSATRPGAKDGARALEWAVLNRAPRTTVTLGDGSAGVILATACSSGPSWRPWADTNAHRIGATYLLTVQTVS